MKKKIELIGLLLGWFAVIAQFIIMLQNRITDIPETIIRFFSFFTILTNILIALYFTSKNFGLKKGLFSIFFNKGTITALATFILILGLIYQVVLRSIWEPTGLQMLVDELLHTVIPLYFLVYWFLYSEPLDYKFKPLLYWMLYPLIYFIGILIRGHLSKFYPYPFVDVTEIGYVGVAKTFIGIFGFIILLIGILVLIGKGKTNANP